MEDFILTLIIQSKSESFLLYLAYLFIIFGVLLGNITNYFSIINFLNYKFIKQDKKISLSLLNRLQIVQDIDLYEKTEEDIQKQIIMKRTWFIILIFFLIFILLFILDYFLISLIEIFNICGAIAIPPICFLFPLFLYWRLNRNDYINKDKKLHYLIFTILMVLFFKVWILTLYSMF